MAKSAKPTIVLIHGAWHTAEGWRPLQDVLEAAGFPTRAVTMPSSGSSNPKEESATKDAALIRSAIVEPLLAESAEFVMVSHSYGVIPASGAIDESMSVAERAMKGLEGGVLGMIFIAGIPAPSNKSMSGACGLGPADFAPFVDQHPEVSSSAQCISHVYIATCIKLIAIDRDISLFAMRRTYSTTTFLLPRRRDGWMHCSPCLRMLWPRGSNLLLGTMIPSGRRQRSSLLSTTMLYPWKFRKPSLRKRVSNIPRLSQVVTRRSLACLIGQRKRLRSSPRDSLNKERLSDPLGNGIFARNRSELSLGLKSEG